MSIGADEPIPRVSSFGVNGGFRRIEDTPRQRSKPEGEGARRAPKKLGEVIARAPNLIPLDGHRYLPETPNERGNLVFSVYQPDVIYYGADLSDWTVREEGGWEATRAIDPVHPPRVIPFWSEMVRWNG